MNPTIFLGDELQLAFDRGATDAGDWHGKATAEDLAMFYREFHERYALDREPGDFHGLTAGTGRPLFSFLRAYYPEHYQTPPPEFGPWSEHHWNAWGMGFEQEAAWFWHGHVKMECGTGAMPEKFLGTELDDAFDQGMKDAGQWTRTAVLDDVRLFYEEFFRRYASDQAPGEYRGMTFAAGMPLRSFLDAHYPALLRSLPPDVEEWTERHWNAWGMGFKQHAAWYWHTLMQTMIAQP